MVCTALYEFRFPLTYHGFAQLRDQLRFVYPDQTTIGSGFRLEIISGSCHAVLSMGLSGRACIDCDDEAMFKFLVDQVLG